MPSSLMHSVNRQFPLLIVMAIIWIWSADFLFSKAILRELDLHSHRDAAGTLAGEYLEARRKGEAREEILERISKFSELLEPGSSLLLYSPQGALQWSSKSCRHPLPNLPSEVLNVYSLEHITPLPAVDVNWCETGDSFLSAYFLQEPVSHISEHGFWVLTSSKPLFGGYLWSFFTTGLEPLLFFVVICFMLVWGTWIFRAFRAELYRFFDALNSQAVRYSDGDYSIRFSGGEFSEFQEVAHAFNRLAEQNQARIEELRVGSTETRELMAGFAHDLRTPMTAIEGGFQLLEKSHDDSEKKQFEALIEKNLRSQMNLLEDLALLKELQPSERTIEFEDILLSPFLLDLRKLIEPTALVRGVGLVFDDVDQSLGIRSQRNSLKRTLLNLLENAVRATPQQGKVELRIRSDEDFLEFLIKNPIGIPSDVSSSGQTVQAGGVSLRRKTGLGQGIARQMAKIHGGSVDFSSQDNSYRACVRLQRSLPRPLERVEEHSNFAQNTYVLDKTASDPIQPFLHFLALSSGAFATKALWPTDFRWNWLCAVVALVFFSVLTRFGKKNPLWAIPLLAIAYIAPGITLPFLPTGFEFFLAGWFFTAVIFLSVQFISESTHSLRWEPVVLLIALPYIFTKPSDMFLLGQILGMLTSGMMTRTRGSFLARRAETWLSSLLGFGLFLSIGALSLGTYTAFLTLNQKLGEKFSRHIFEVLKQQEFTSAEATKDFLRRVWEQNVLSDFSFSPPGSNERVLIGSHREEYYRIKSRQLYLRCQDKDCLGVLAETPGDHFDSVFHRISSNRSLFIIPMQILGAIVLIWLFVRVWALRFRDQIQRLRKGIDELQTQGVVAQIPVFAGEESAILARSLETLSARCRAVEASIKRKQVEFAQLLNAAYRALSHAQSSLANALSGPHHNQEGIQSGVENLRLSIESVFELALVQRADSEEIEEFSFSELVFEELESVQATQKTGIKIISQIDDGLMTIGAPIELVLFGIRFFLRKALAGVKDNEPIGVTTKVENFSVVLTLSFVHRDEFDWSKSLDGRLDALVWEYIQRRFEGLGGKIEVLTELMDNSVYLLRLQYPLSERTS